MAALADGSKALHAKEIFFRVEFPNGSHQRVGKANSLLAAPVSYTHLDVYKRQASLTVQRRRVAQQSTSDRLAAPPRPSTIRALTGSSPCLLYTSRCV